MEGVVSGQEFFRPAQNLPAKWLVDTVLIQVSLCECLSFEEGLARCIRAPAKPPASSCTRSRASHAKNKGSN